VRKISLEERRQALSEHVLLAQQLGGQGHALHFMRKFMMWYTRGLPGASAFRRAAGPAQDLQELWRLSVRYFEGLKEVA
jgi:tRNA-dihydrouridine synthase